MEATFAKASPKNIFICVLVLGCESPVSSSQSLFIELQIRRDRSLVIDRFQFDSLLASL